MIVRTPNKTVQSPQWYAKASPRWQIVHTSIVAAGDELEIAFREWAPQLGMPVLALTHHISQMERYGLIAVRRRGSVGSAYGGRLTNVYRSLMPWSTWEVMAPVIFTESRRLRRNEADVRHRAARRSRSQELVEAEERALLLEQAADRIVAAAALVRVVSTPDELDADDLKGW